MSQKIIFNIHLGSAVVPTSQNLWLLGFFLGDGHAVPHHVIERRSLGTVLLDGRIRACTVFKYYCHPRFWSYVSWRHCCCTNQDVLVLPITPPGLHARLDTNRDWPRGNVLWLYLLGIMWGARKIVVFVEWRILSHGVGTRTNKFHDMIKGTRNDMYCTKR